MTPPVIAIVGLSDTGKTRTAVALVETLVGQGYRIGAVKHAPHGHSVDRPESDSALLFASGAARVMVSSPRQVSSVARAADDTALEEILTSFDSNYDLVIAEGFKGSTVPKVLVSGAEEVSPRPENVIAVVGDGPAVDGVPSYGFDQIEELAKQIREQVMAGPAGGPTMTVVVDGVAVRMVPFAVGALGGVIRGFLASLKGVPKDLDSVRIIVDSPPSDGA